MKKCAILLAAAVLFTLSGCQLARDREGTDQGYLIGVYITREYLDLMDMEAYLNDHLNEVVDGETIVVEEGEAQAYQERIYAVNVSDDPEHPEYEFPDIEGVPVYCVPVPNSDGDGYCWTSGCAPEVWQYNAYTAKDDMDAVVITADFYVSADERRHEFYANPMYRTEDGKVYLVSGTGISGDMGEAGTSMGQTVEETSTMTINGETTQQQCEVKVTITSVYPMEKTVLLQMDANSRAIAAEEFLPGQAPTEFTPEADTAYLVVESHRLSKSGSRTVDRELFDREDTSFATYQEGEDGFFCRMDTVIHWPD